MLKIRKNSLTVHIKMRLF